MQLQHDKVCYNKYKSIRFRIIPLIFLLIVSQIVTSTFLLYRSWQDYKQAQEIQNIDQISYPLVNAMMNFMFERGRMNVVLSTVEPISDENRRFIEERRKLSDTLIQTAFTMMNTKYNKEADMLSKQYEEIKTLRKVADKESLKPLNNREPQVVKVWYNKCTDFVNNVSNSLQKIGSNTEQFGLISNYYYINIYSMEFRNIVGTESSMITSAIAGNKTLSEDDYNKLLVLRGKSEQVWFDIENRVSFIDSKNINEAKESVIEKYYVDFLKVQDRMINSQSQPQQQFDANKANEVAKLSVPALDSIYLLVDTANKEANVYAHTIIHKAYIRFIIGIIQFLFTIFIMIFIPIYFNKRYINPLNVIAKSVKQLWLGKTDIDIIATGRDDEIGMLSKAVEMLREKIIEDLMLKNQLKKISETDVLTDLYNRRYIIKKMEEEVARYKRNQKVFSIIMCDIDDFKKFNDTYGHDCGDYVLIYTSRFIDNICRKQDILARWGGEEFLIFLPETDLKGASILAEKIRKGLENRNMQYEQFNMKVTMTFGVSEYIESIGINGSIKNADNALLEGKIKGKNRVMVRWEK